MRRCRVEIEIALFHVLAVVALRPGQAEEALFEDGVLSVPKSQGKAEAAFAVGDAEQTVLAPAVGAAARVLVGESNPRLSREASSLRAR